jgi:NO-binding membrane sensor protein with MHYT domain
MLVGAVLLGSGIGTMHYSGMAAMQLSPMLGYDPLFFGLSILVAVFYLMWLYLRASIYIDMCQS